VTAAATEALGSGCGRDTTRRASGLAPGDILTSYIEGIGEMRHRFAAARET